MAYIEDDYAKLEDFVYSVESRSEAQEAFTSKLLHIIADLFNQPLYSDLIILLEDGSQLWGHKLVLLGRGDDWGEPGLEQAEYLDLQNIKHEVAYAMINWIYTDDLDETKDKNFYVELLEVATKFKLEFLHIRCQKILLNMVTSENCIEMYTLSDRVGAVLVTEHCSAYLRQQNICKLEPIDETSSMPENDSTHLEPSEQSSMTEEETPESAETLDTFVSETNLSNSTKADMMKPTTVPYNCDKCGKQYIRLPNLQRHKQICANENQHFCKICKCLFDNESKLNSHECKAIVCELCDATFKTKGDLNIHKDEHVGKDEEKCMECGKCFPTLTKLKKHQKSHEPIECKECYKICKNENELKVHTKCHVNDLKCEVCEKVFCSRSNLLRHLKIHRGEKPFSCDECGQSFTQNNDLLRHFKIHSGDKEFKCHICGYLFSRNSALNQHLRTHTNEKPYKCEKCSREFSSNSSLCRHARMHAGIRPFVCETCNKGFIAGSDLQRHKRVHFPTLKYQCHICQRIYLSRPELNLHMKYHESESNIETIQVLEIASDLVKHEQMEVSEHVTAVTTN